MMVTPNYSEGYIDALNFVVKIVEVDDEYTSGHEAGVSARDHYYIACQRFDVEGG